VLTQPFKHLGKPFHPGSICWSKAPKGVKYGQMKGVAVLPPSELRGVGLRRAAGLEMQFLLNLSLVALSAARCVLLANERLKPAPAPCSKWVYLGAVVMEVSN